MVGRYQNIVPHSVIIALLCLFPAFSWALSTVTAEVDKNPVFAGEPFTLVVTADDNISTSAFSARQLAQPGLTLGNTSTSSQTSMINGAVTRLTSWRTVLIFEKPGRFTLPAIEINGQKTKPISIEVEPAAETAVTRENDVFVTTELSSQSIYPGQQAIYRVKLHLARELQGGNLSEPEHEQLEISKIGNDKESTALINGIRYRVIERVYGLSPKASGEFTLDGPVFRGKVLLRLDNNRSSFTIPVEKQADAKTLTVKAKPANAPEPWLVGDIAQLTEAWQPDSDQVRVGEPISRTVTLQVAGSRPELLPDITIDYPASLKIYPDKSTSGSELNGEQAMAWRTESSALIATVPGTLTLPAVRIPWWSARTNQLEYAELPPRTLKVLAAEPIPGQPVLGATSQPAQPTQPVPSAPAQVITAVNEQQLDLWRNLAIGMSVLCLLLVAGWATHVRLLKRLPRETAVNETDTPGNFEHWAALKHTLAKNDIEQVPRRLQAWLIAEYGSSMISTLKPHCSTACYRQIAHEYKHLCESRYSPSKRGWHGKKLLSLLKKVRSGQPVTKQKASKRQQRKASLPALYPS